LALKQRGFADVDSVLGQTIDAPEKIALVRCDLQCERAAVAPYRRPGPGPPDASVS
jgi:hypothetical protein